MGGISKQSNDNDAADVSYDAEMRIFRSLFKLCVKMSIAVNTTPCDLKPTHKLQTKGNVSAEVMILNHHLEAFVRFEQST